MVGGVERKGAMRTTKQIIIVPTYVRSGLEMTDRCYLANGVPFSRFSIMGMILP